MRTLLLLVLAIVSLPVSAEELQFDLSGLALPVGEAGSPHVPYDVTFVLKTLSGQTSSTFSSGCLNAWSFSDVQVFNLSATVGGQRVLNVPSTLARGSGGDLFENCTLEAGGILIGKNGFFMTDIVSQRTTPLNPQDPLADLLTNLCRPPVCVVGGEGSLPGWNLSGAHVTVSVVPEPGMLGLTLLGLGAVGLLLCRRRLALPTAA